MIIKKTILATMLSLFIMGCCSAETGIPEQPQLSLPINTSPDNSSQPEQDSNSPPEQNTNQQQPNSTPNSQVAAQFKEGTDYKKITPAIPSDSSNSIQIINFFSYNCKGCYELDKSLNDMSADMPYYVKFIKSPVATDIKYAYPVRVYFALQQIGANNVSSALFKASAEGEIDVTDYRNYPKLRSWLINRQINIKDFETAFDSGEVLSKVSAAPSVVKQYNLDSLPSVAIDGKYLVDAKMLMNTANPENTKKLITFLVNKASKEKMQSRREE